MSWTLNVPTTDAAQASGQDAPVTISLASYAKATV